MSLIKNSIILLAFIMAMVSCSKDEEETKIIENPVSSSNFDSGYLSISMSGANTMVDSIVYTNSTKGFSFKIDPALVTFLPGDTTGLYTKAMRNGNTGDDVSCCFYVNTATTLGVLFQEDSIPLSPVAVGLNCINGTY